MEAGAVWVRSCWCGGIFSLGVVSRESPGCFACSVMIRRELLLSVEAEFAGGAVGAEATGQVEDRSGAGGYGGVGAETAEGEEAGGLVEGEAGAELAGRGAENSAAESGIEGA